jgi:hypothetical protein
VQAPSQQHKEVDMIIDCYHNDLTRIINQRFTDRHERKARNFKRYTRQYRRRG